MLLLLLKYDTRKLIYFYFLIFILKTHIRNFLKSCRPRHVPISKSGIVVTLV